MSKIKTGQVAYDGDRLVIFPPDCYGPRPEPYVAPPPPPAPPQYTYLVGATDDGLFKIGWTANPGRRLYALRQIEKNPGLQMIHRITSADGYWLEQYLHAAFGHWRVSRREWFCLSAADVALFRTITAANVADDLPDDVRRWFAYCGSPHRVERGRLHRLRVTEGERLAKDLPALLDHARGGRLDLETVLRGWLAACRSADHAKVLRMAIGGDFGGVLWAEHAARVVPCPDRLAYARKLRQRHDRLRKAVAWLYPETRGEPLWEYHY
jgi:hypothetical protein